MGEAFQAVCSACQHTFRASKGGGFSFESLRCDRCGNDTEVKHKDVWDSYLAMLKGLQTNMPEPDGADGRTYAGEPISEEEFRSRVEVKAGACPCGGRFSFDAPLRCPACGSKKVANDGTFSMRFD